MSARFVPSPVPAGEDRAYLDFVLGLKQHFARAAFPALRQEYEAAIANHGDAQPTSARAVGDVVADLPAYPLFQWLERNPQKMMWRRLERMIQPHAAELDDGLNREIAQPLGTLELDPDLKLPAYYAQTEFHIQPGGVWSSAADTFVYEVGAKIVMIGENDDYRFHRLFVETAIPSTRTEGTGRFTRTEGTGLPYRAILDLGCGFGKSTRPFVDAFPQAEVVGIDLSAPNLKLAHQQAERLGKRITFSQRAAEATGYAAASFDLVTATMLIHEVPMPVLRRILAEAQRVLRPGGWLVVLDFAHTGDAFRDFIMDGHGARNNEPYMPHLFRTDIRQLLQETGFQQAEVIPFDERGPGLLDQSTWPTRPEWHFPWAVIRAERGH